MEQAFEPTCSWMDKRRAWRIRSSSQECGGWTGTRSARQQGLYHNIHIGILQHKLTRGLVSVQSQLGTRFSCCNFECEHVLGLVGIYNNFNLPGIQPTWPQQLLQSEPLSPVTPWLNINMQAKPTANLWITQLSSMTTEDAGDTE